jgi:Leucine-rich repeat (LRR) protein
MSGIKGIIETHRARLEASGLLRRQAPFVLSPRIAAMRPSLTKVQAAVAEGCLRINAVQPSPMSTLFDITLPKLELVLLELGEARAEQIVGRLCEHGKAMVEQHGLDRARNHLEELFTDLPNYEAKVREVGGAEEIIEAYRKYEYESIANELYLKLKLGDKIESVNKNDDGMLELDMETSTNSDDLATIRKAKNIRKLGIMATNVIDIKNLDGMGGLQELYLGENHHLSRDLTPLINLIGLQLLYLSGTNVSDLSSLNGLAGLKILHLAGTPVSDLGPLSRLSSLRTLKLEGTQVSDLSPLSGLANLQELDLVGTKVSDLSPLIGLTSLQKIGLRGTRVSDLTPLNGLRSIQELDLTDTPISDLTPLSGLTSLKELHLAGTRIRDLTPISRSSGLRELFIEETPISDLRPLSGLGGLQYLCLGAKQVSDEQIEELARAIPGLLFDGI